MEVTSIVVVPLTASLICEPHGVQRVRIKPRWWLGSRTPELQVLAISWVGGQNWCTKFSGKQSLEAEVSRRREAH